MTKKQSEFLNYILELLEPSGGITSHRMFGGYSIRKYGISFALIFKDEVYFKVGDSNIDDYKEIGSQPMVYEAKGKSIAVSNWNVPIDILEDNQKLMNFIDKSYQVALKLKMKEKNKKKK